MTHAHLLVQLSEATRTRLNEAGWPLVARVNVLSQALEAEAAGWDMFPMADEFLSVFDGFSTETEEEFLVGAWKAVPIYAPDHATLRELRRSKRLFPVGLAAGWVNLLLTDHGQVLTSLNGRIQSDTHLDKLVNCVLSQREQDELERNNDSG